MTIQPAPIAFRDEELAALDAQASAIFGEVVVLAAIKGLHPPIGVEMTLARILEYSQALKAELRRMVTPHWDIRCGTARAVSDVS